MDRIENGLRPGFTTGTCAQAAAKGACLMLTTGRSRRKIEVETPSGRRLVLRPVDQKRGRDFAMCAIVKDSGDDPDVTDGAKIYAKVRFSSKKGIWLTGGEGVGMVTKPGLALDVGEYAINPVPRRMIIKEVSRLLPKDKGLEVIISVPHGKRLARRTFNPRLGVVGGISIIGTTGIVEPKSTAAYKASLSLQLDVLKALKIKRAVLVLGYVGERFAKERLKLNEDSIVRIGDHVGFMLRECAEKKIKDVLLIGHVGKLVKIARGQFDTHSRFGDERIETIAGYAKTCGAKRETIEELSRETTAEGTIDILRRDKLMGLFGKIAREALLKIDEFLGGRIAVRCMLLSLEGEVLGDASKKEMR